MTDYALVLTRRYPGREWSLNGDDYAGLIMLDGGTKPTKATLDSKWDEVQSEIAWEAVRAERDRRLTACDWTQVADAALTNEAKYDWATYRQQLRDIPQTFDDPSQVVWPEEP